MTGFTFILLQEICHLQKTNKYHRLSQIFKDPLADFAKSKGFLNNWIKFVLLGKHLFFWQLFKELSWYLVASSAKEHHQNKLHCRHQYVLKRDRRLVLFEVSYTLNERHLPDKKVWPKIKPCLCSVELVKHKNLIRYHLNNSNFKRYVVYCLVVGRLG